MFSMVPLFYVLVALLAFLAVMIVTVIIIYRHEKELTEKRAAAVVNPHLQVLEERTESLLASISVFFSAFAKMRARGGVKKHESVTVTQLSMAGFYDPHAYDIYYGIRIVTPLACAALVAVSTNQLGFVSGALGVGLLLPSSVLKYLVKKRKAVIARSVPNMLDLLVICLNAGSGVDQAIKRTAETLRVFNPALCRELDETMQLQMVGMTRVQAWERMKLRTGVEDIGAVADLFAQAEVFGTTIIDSLRALSESIRTQRRQKIEELAAKKAIELIVPVVLFIFPPVVIVMLGPTMITILRGFAAIGH